MKSRHKVIAEVTRYLSTRLLPFACVGDKLLADSFCGYRKDVRARASYSLKLVALEGFRGNYDHC